MRRAARAFGIGLLLLGSGCDARTSSSDSEALQLRAQAQATHEQPMSADEARRAGATAGVVSPRLADCTAHCTKMLGDVTRTMSDQARAGFTQTCRESCQQQITGVSGPARQRAEKAAADWQSLYLTGQLIDQSVFCIRRLSEASPQAVALVKAVETAKQSPEALAADELERETRQVGEELARTEEGRRVAVARDELARVNTSAGPRSAAADAAREAVSAARAKADATPLGKRFVEAAARAKDARAKANERPAMVEAVRAYQVWTEARRTRLQSAPAEEQSRLQKAMADCIDAWTAEQMRGPARSP